MSKTKSPQPAGKAASRTPGTNHAQGSLFADIPLPAAPSSTRGAPKAKAKAATTPSREPTGPKVRGRRRPQPDGLAALYEKLLAEGDYPETTVTLKPSMVGTHPAHPDKIVGDGDEAIRTLRYAIMSNRDGTHLGNVLVHGESRFTLVAPLIQERVTIHLNLPAVAMRADVAAEAYLARTASPAQAATPRASRRSA